MLLPSATLLVNQKYHNYKITLTAVPTYIVSIPSFPKAVLNIFDTSGITLHITAKATLNIYSNPTTYSGAFTRAATVQGSGITVNYTSAVTNIDSIIATKSSDSNVVKGVQLD